MAKFKENKRIKTKKLKNSLSTVIEMMTMKIVTK